MSGWYTDFDYLNPNFITTSAGILNNILDSVVERKKSIRDVTAVPERRVDPLLPNAANGTLLNYLDSVVDSMFAVIRNTPRARWLKRAIVQDDDSDKLWLLGGSFVTNDLCYDDVGNEIAVIGGYVDFSEYFAQKSNFPSNPPEIIEFWNQWITGHYKMINALQRSAMVHYGQSGIPAYKKPAFKEGQGSHPTDLSIAISDAKTAWDAVGWTELGWTNTGTRPYQYAWAKKILGEPYFAYFKNRKDKYRWWSSIDASVKSTMFFWNNAINENITSPPSDWYYESKDGYTENAYNFIESSGAETDFYEMSDWINLNDKSSDPTRSPNVFYNCHLDRTTLENDWMGINGFKFRAP